MDPSKSRGRARGRARPIDSTGMQSRPGQGPRPTQPQQPQGAWGPRSTGPVPRPVERDAPPAWGPSRPHAAYSAPLRAPAPSHPGSGRASTRDSAPTHIVEDVRRLTIGAGGDHGGNMSSDASGSSAGRGAVRGRRQIGHENLATRPANLGSKKGVTGTPVRLSANYFQLITHTDWALYQYRVDFAPEEDRTRVKKQLFYQAAKDALAGYLFDGTMVFTSRRLVPDPMELFVNPPEGSTRTEPIRITLRLVGDVAMGDYHLIQFFNIMMRRCFGYMNLQLVGRNFYDAIAKISVPQYDIELWPGYVTSIRQHENKILLCCEISHKFMRKENVLDVLEGCAKRDREHYKRNFTQQIVGSVVLTDYNNRTYRIDDVDWEVTPASSFGKSDGSSVTYVQYYRDRYQLKINVMDQPMLVSRAKPRELRAGMAEILYLVPELCRMTGLTEHERNNIQMMRSLADHTRLAPEGRIARLEAFSYRMRTNKKIVEELKKWDMELASKLVDFPGRVLLPETILQGTDGKYRYGAGQETDWTKNLRSNQMLTLGSVETWIVICPTNMKRDVHAFVQSLVKAAAGMSFRLNAPKLQEVSDDRPASILEGLDMAINTHNPSFILIAVTNNKADRYAAIKKKCCVDRAVPTQVILKKNIMSKSVLSVATKVAIQINCKLGGAPWTVDMPLSTLMVVGFDVCHDTMNKGKSFGAMVASLDKPCTRYFSAVTPHSNGEELSNDFSLNMIKACRGYAEVNGGRYPERILIFRDGVGDGQLPYVLQHEVTMIRDALTKNIYKEQPLRLGFIVVTKRINTRLFAGSKNPMPGTVVDDVITLPHRYDYFIVSQCVRQGTVSPTSYNVIYDSLGLDPDKLQRLTYKLTHLYFNWSGTVRVPAPCQYAHKLAFLVSQSLHRNPNARLETTLFFL